MELIDRYVSAVGRYLPEKTRADIEMELRSLIMDALDTRMQGRDPSEDDIVAVLHEMGRPEEIAARYAPVRRYLIGPELFPSYIAVTGIVVVVVATAVLIGRVVQQTMDPNSVGGMISGVLVDLLSGISSAVGSVTLVFAVLERFLPGATKATANGGRWDPRKLPKPTLHESKVDVGERAMELFFVVAALVVLNLFLDRIGIYYRGESGWVFAPMLNTDVIAFYRPFWNVVLVVSLVLHTVLLNRRMWTPATRIAQIVVGGASVALLLGMLSATWIPPGGLATLGTEKIVADLDKVGDWINIGIRIGILAAAVVCALDVWKHVKQLVRVTR